MRNIVGYVLRYRSGHYGSKLYSTQSAARGACTRMFTPSFSEEVTIVPVYE
jgi:hypothetical protein